MLDKKGQALVEFILILPVLIMIVLTVIDFGRIYVSKTDLESSLLMINDIDRESFTKESIEDMIRLKGNNDIIVNVTKDGKYKVVTLTKTLDIITPGLNLFISDPYVISVDRVILDE